ncbi:conserved hypothetical protein [Histoplasma capsulatum G186AR]|uniref:Uncharacterized protein n=2 Tax=Ajellomyces capsulatus TaxID=5037 RepID=C0NV98_AJECG|nr:uncharacterized protein HCBG_07078 [Histoplasma capsulatum G186AR]EEH04437.1 conserved hypothetical protein [Histoplasma capsulatum G186AR]KAG5296269.1 hypothetical protein I7I52_06872 [Histoplasma capsulatum]QSS74251.1 hypothetical protein I7I50_09351 [Histoplasma capsulatum G186AR]
MSCISVKRQREDSFERADLDWHWDRKKPRPLPFRTSPTSKHTTLFSQTHQFFDTPTESSDDDDNGATSEVAMVPRYQTGKKDDMTYLSIRVQPCHDNDSDVEMTDLPRSSSNTIAPCSAAELTPNWSGSVMSSPIPHRLIVQSLNISGGRTATPIYGHFTANMSINAMREDSGTANDTSGFVPPSTTISDSIDVATSIASSTRSLVVLSDGEDRWRPRRLPSPISEGEISPMTTFSQIDRHFESTTLATANNLRKSSSFTHSWEKEPADTSTLEPQQRSLTPHHSLNHNITSTANDTSGNSTFSDYTKQPVPDQKQRCHIDDNPSIHTWSRQPAYDNASSENSDTAIPQRKKTGGPNKMSIAMGYRADCDKCQRRVPGHYSHIIRG